MRVFFAVLRKELRVTFVSPLAWVFLVAFLFLAGLFFYLGVATTGSASLRTMMANLSLALLFLLPMLTMRHFAEESRTGTLELMMTAPVPIWSLVLGKWASSVVLCAILLMGTGLFPAILAYYGEPDWGVVGSSYLGLMLCCMTFCAAGLFSSSLTDEPVAGGLLGVIFLLPVWIAGPAAEMVDESLWRTILRELSLQSHVGAMARGVIDTADLAWFLLLTGGFLFLAWRSVESRRWR